MVAEGKECSARTRAANNVYGIRIYFPVFWGLSRECFQEEGAGRPILPGVGKSGKSESGGSECCLVFQDLCSGKTQWWRDGIGHGLGGKIFVLLFDIRQTRACFED